MVFTDAFGRTDTWTLESIKNCVGPGWGDILDRLIADLFALGWDGHLHQVKEKFGGLRFYVGPGSDAIFDRIDQADAESCKTCEECGAPGKIWPGWYWWITHCAACNQKRWSEEKGRLGKADTYTSYEDWAARPLGKP